MLHFTQYPILLSLFSLQFNMLQSYSHQVYPASAPTPQLCASFMWNFSSVLNKFLYFYDSHFFLLLNRIWTKLLRDTQSFLSLLLVLPCTQPHPLAQGAEMREQEVAYSLLPSEFCLKSPLFYYHWGPSSLSLLPSLSIFPLLPSLVCVCVCLFICVCILKCLNGICVPWDHLLLGIILTLASSSVQVSPHCLLSPSSRTKYPLRASWLLFWPIMWSSFTSRISGLRLSLKQSLSRFYFVSTAFQVSWHTIEQRYRYNSESPK